MGFTDSKKSTVNNIALLEVLGNLPKGRSVSSLDSVNSKSKNLMPYLIDLLSVTCKDNAKNPRDRNKCESTRILTEILAEFFPILLRILKEGIIKAIKAGLACNVDFKLPTFNVKIKLKLSQIDFSNLLKVDPTSDVGSMFYGKNATKDFNWFLNNLIQSGGGGTWAGILDLNFNQTTQELEIGLNPGYVASGGGKSFENLLEDFINSIDLMGKEQFMAKLMDKLNGSLSAALPTPPSLDQLIALEKVAGLQDKINSSDPCKEDYQFEDSFFTFTNDELFSMEEKANQKYIGTVNLNVGCGIVPVTSDPKVVKASFDEIRNTPPSKVNVVIEKSIDTLNNDLTKNLSPENQKVAKLSLNAKMIEEIPKVLTNVILEPKIVALYQIALKLVNGPLDPLTPPVGSGSLPSNDANLNATNGFDYAKATKVFFEYVSREALAALLEILFNQIKKEIISLVEQIAIKIVKEQATLRLKAISSIVTGVVDGVLTTIPSPNSTN